MIKVKLLSTGRIYKVKTYSEALTLATILHNRTGSKCKIIK